MYSFNTFELLHRRHLSPIDHWAPFAIVLLTIILIKVSTIKKLKCSLNLIAISLWKLRVILSKALAGFRWCDFGSPFFWVWVFIWSYIWLYKLSIIDLACCDGLFECLSKFLCFMRSDFWGEIRGEFFDVAL